MKLLPAIVIGAFSCHSVLAQEKIFHQPKAKGEWQYVYPFANKSYVVAIQYGSKDSEEDGLKTSMIYFGKLGKTDQIFWKEELKMRLVKDNIRYEDFNGDGVKDLLIFEDTGARGANAFYNLYLLNPLNHSVKKVNGFNKIVNPAYDKKHSVITGSGLAGDDNYISIYRINTKYQAYQIGDSFKETEAMDVDQKIAELLKKNKQTSFER